MHETIALAVRRAHEAGAHRILEIRLRVGALSGVVPEALEFAFELLRAGTLAESARLQIVPVPATCWCASCQDEFGVPDLIAECPRCGQPSAELRRGRELELDSLEID